MQHWCCPQVHTARVSQAQLGDCYHRCTVVATRAASFQVGLEVEWSTAHPRLAKWALAAMAMREQMRVAMAHLAHTASQLSGDMNAGYIDYDEVDDRRGCRPVDSSDSEQEENFDCGDVSVKRAGVHVPLTSLRSHYFLLLHFCALSPMSGHVNGVFFSHLGLLLIMIGMEFALHSSHSMIARVCTSPRTCARSSERCLAMCHSASSCISPSC